MLYHIGLFFHFTAIIIVAGGSIGSVLAEQELWSKIEKGEGGEKSILAILTKAPLLIQAAVILFLLSGLVLLYSVNWVYLSQPWFIAKFLLFVSLPIRGGIIGKSTIAQVAAEINKPRIDQQALLALKAKMQRFHIVQYCILAVIILLVIFKF